MRLTKTEHGFRIHDGEKSRTFANSDMRRLRARTVFLQTVNSNYSHDRAYQQTLAEMLNEEGGQV